MEVSGYVDIFATKGIEYIFILCFIVVLVFFWKFLNRTGGTARFDSAYDVPGQQGFQNCRFRQNLHYHQGHSWVEQEGPDVGTIGVDDFAQKLIGPLDFIDLPRVGALLEQGEKAWRLGSNSTIIDILSPVAGEVMAINNQVLDDPQVVNRDPYGNGWLLKVRAPKMKSNMTNLLKGKLASAWMKENIEDFYRKIAQGSGSPTHIDLISENEAAGEQSRDRWNELAREFLLCK